MALPINSRTLGLHSQGYIFTLLRLFVSHNENEVLLIQPLILRKFVSFVENIFKKFLLIQTLGAYAQKPNLVISYLRAPFEQECVITK